RRCFDTNLQSVAGKETIANLGAAEVQTLPATLRRWFDFYNGYDPLFTWWAEAPFKATDTALQAYGTFLLERVAGVPVATNSDFAVTAIGAAGGRGGASSLPGQRVGSNPFAAGAGTGGRTGAGASLNAKPGDASDIIGDPIGRDGLMSELAYEMIPYSPEELIAIANQEFAWCEDQMKRASRELGFGDDSKKALEH